MVMSAPRWLESSRLPLLCKQASADCLYEQKAPLLSLGLNIWFIVDARNFEAELFLSLDRFMP